MARRTRRATLAGALLACAALAQAAPPAAAPGQHVTRTAFVFTGLEQSLLMALREHDRARIDALVGEDFEMVVARDPGNAIARDDWLAGMLKPNAAAYAVVDLTARELGPVAIASFVLRPDPPRAGTPRVFVVDTWERSGNDLQLTARHAAPFSDARQRLPGEPSTAAMPKQK